MVAIEKKETVVRIFFVKTELERLVADLIAGAYKDGSTCYLFAYKESLLGQFLWDKWEASQFLNLKEKRGFLAGQRTALSHLLKVEPVIKSKSNSANRIEIYLSRLKNNNSNYSIHFLSELFPLSDVKVNIIPHGASNFYRGQLSKKEIKKMQGKNNWIVRSLYPRLKYYAFEGDRYGADDSVIKGIYTFPGHNLDDKKSKMIDSYMLNSKCLETESESNDILIVGQPVYKRERMTPKHVEKIDAAIIQLIKDVGGDKVYFLPHPREDGSMCFFQQGFELLETDESLELILLKRKFRTVVSSFSTGLFTSQIILGDQCTTYAVGMNLVNLPASDLKEMRKGFEAVGVKLIDL